MALLRTLADADSTQLLSAPLNLHLVHSRSRNVQGLLTALAAHTDLVYVQPDYIVTAGTTPNDPSFTYLWGLQNDGHMVLSGLHDRIAAVEDVVDCHNR